MENMVTKFIFSWKYFWDPFYLICVGMIVWFILKHADCQIISYFVVINMFDASYIPIPF